jgi:hypothetical protein
MKVLLEEVMLLTMCRMKEVSTVVNGTLEWEKVQNLGKVFWNSFESADW